MPKSRAILTFPYVIAQELLTRSLDLGSGSGRYLAHLARHRPDARS